MVHAFAMQVSRTTTEFALSVLREHYGAHHQISVFSSVDKIPPILLLPQLVSVIQDTECSVDHAKLVLITTSSPTDTVSPALSMPPTILKAKPVSAQLDSSPTNGEFAPENAEPMRCTIARLKVAHASMDLER